MRIVSKSSEVLEPMKSTSTPSQPSPSRASPPSRPPAPVDCISMLLDAQSEHITPPPPPHTPATGLEKQSSPQPEESGPKRDRPLSSTGKDRANPIDLDDFDEGDSEQHEGRTSDDEPLDPGKENLVFGTVFEKVAQYDHCLDEGDNPWNIALHRPLYPSQVIGFRWMLDRH